MTEFQIKKKDSFLQNNGDENDILKGNQLFLNIQSNYSISGSNETKIPTKIVEKEVTTSIKLENEKEASRFQNEDEKKINSQRKIVFYFFKT